MATNPNGKRTQGTGPEEEPREKRRCTERPECRYGENCYRRNLDHLRQFSHKHLEDMIGKEKDPSLSSIVLEQLAILSDVRKRRNPGTTQCRSSDNSKSESFASSSAQVSISERHSCSFATKLNSASPFNFFLTKVNGEVKTHSEPLTIKFEDLLCSSLGEIQSSVQINFMVDLDWLMEKYTLGQITCEPLLIVYGAENPQLSDKTQLRPWITTVRVKPKYPYGHHHTKMSLFQYKSGDIRVVIHTANLIEDDWEEKTQGVWVSPSCPAISSGSGESPSGFKGDLLRYISFYKLPQLREWLEKLRCADFSQVRVCFIPSVPQSHQGSDGDQWGHRYMRVLLWRHACLPMTNSHGWPLVNQCSSIGSLGPEPGSWMGGELRESFSTGQKVSGKKNPASQFHLVYPTFRNVMGSLEGPFGGSCLPYNSQTHSKQVWLDKHLHQWVSKERHRSRAMPHIKTYCRLSPDLQKASWFLLTSANLSKAAWGKEAKSGSNLLIMSYEAGVLFLPKFVTETDYFALNHSGSPNPKEFPFPYSLPLTGYSDDDKPWFSNMP